ncbi:serine/threonine-protein phosphatase 4 regulatory subunit 1-like isoform X1 [Diabrotica undecimpunctata]|uniref:serine/threonine-protein phosphatase 4 regulatory subunit 1-like isoform X1 n=2 Tax=Diabrotica undecimpunctata TaxID=50387 RepID=UPI003B63C122
MADVSSIHNDFIDDSDEGFEQGDCPFGNAEDEAALTPLMRIQKYAKGPIPIRHKVAKAVLDEFRTWPPETLLQDLPEIMKVLTSTADESILRVELLEQIPHIAAQAIACSSEVPAFKNIVSDHIIPFVVRSLGCSENTLVTHSTLIQLIEQGFISKLQAEIQVCPTILALTKLETTTDVNTSAINLMSKLAPLLGRDVTERVFLGRFIDLCSSPIFHIRTVCAAYFGNFSAVISHDSVEKILVPKYLTLCTDDVWGVRKTCAEAITYVSCACSQNTRTLKLAPTFGVLLKDDCRWVRVSAFHSLGPFISTFANPPITKMDYSNNGDLVLVNGEGAEFMISVTTPLLSLHERFSVNNPKEANIMMNPLNLGEMDLEETGWIEKIKDDDIPGSSSDIQSEENSSESSDTVANADGNVENLNDKGSIEDPKTTPNVIVCDNISEKINNQLTDAMQNIKLIVNNSNLNIEHSTNVNNELSQLNSNVTTEDKITNTNKDTNDNEQKVNINNNGTIEDDLHLFYSHNYWYISPELPLDPVLVCGEESSNILNGAGDSIHLENNSADGSKSDNNNSTISIDESDVTNDGTNENSVAEKPEPPQKIVPQILVDHYIAMTYPMLSLNIEYEMAYHCAYSLPAVVLTLGSENWHLLEDTVFTLAGDIQYKVRRTVASSLHELAIILGSEMATNSLTQLFEGFIKDLDEVRIEILKHLAAFLKVINPAKRIAYLPRLVEFLQTDNEWNWRFREELAKQLLELMELFKPADISKHVGGIAIVLLYDKVAAVREAALALVTEIISYTSSEPNLTPGFLIKLAETFAHSKKWKRRQTFCLMCIEILKEEALEPEQFVSEVMPHLLDLSWDPVANVRLVVARCLSRYILNNLYFVDLSSDHCEGLETVLRRLQADKDSDVRQSAEV